MNAETTAAFEPGREAFRLLAELEAVLVLTAEHSPCATVTSFVDSAIQFKRVADFLHAHQHIGEEA